MRNLNLFTDMKNLMRLMLVAFMAVAFVNCGGGDGGDEPGPAPDVDKVTLTTMSGEWKVTSWSGGDIIGNGHDIYVRLTGSVLEIYQVNINFAGVAYYKANVTLDEATSILSGTYSDGEKLASTYKVEQSNANNMKWTAQGSEKVVTTFVKGAIPADVVERATLSDDVRSIVDYRFF